MSAPEPIEQVEVFNPYNYGVRPSDDLTLLAPLKSPHFTGTPTAPTAPVDTSSNQIATTSYVKRQGYLTTTTGDSRYVTQTYVANNYAALSGATFTGQTQVSYNSGGDGTLLSLTDTNKNIIFKPNSDQGSLNGVAQAGDAVIAAFTNAQGTQPLTLTTWASGYSGIRIDPTTPKVEMIVGTSSSNQSVVECNTTTVSIKPSITFPDGSVQNTAFIPSDYAPIDSPTFTGTPTVPGYAPIDSPTFTGTPTISSAAIATETYVTNALTPYALLAGDTFTGKTSVTYAKPGGDASMFDVIDTTGGITGLVLLPNSFLRAWNGIVGQGDVVITAYGQVEQKILTLTTNSNLNSGIRVHPSKVELLAGGTYGNASTTAVECNSTTVSIKPNLTFPDGSVQSTAFTAGTYAPINSPTFTGTPTASTAAPGTNSTQIATTEYVQSEGFAPIHSPTFTGTPTASTAAPGTNSTQIATTEYVQSEGFAPQLDPNFTGTPRITGTPTQGTTTIATQGYVTSAINALNVTYAPLSGADFGGKTTIRYANPTNQYKMFEVFDTTANGNGLVVYPNSTFDGAYNGVVRQGDVIVVGTAGSETVATALTLVTHTNNNSGIRILPTRVKLLAGGALGSPTTEVDCNSTTVNIKPSITFPDNTVQTTAYSAVSMSGVGGVQTVHSLANNSVIYAAGKSFQIKFNGTITKNTGLGAVKFRLLFNSWSTVNFFTISMDFVLFPHRFSWQTNYTTYPAKYNINNRINGDNAWNYSEAIIGYAQYGRQYWSFNQDFGNSGIPGVNGVMVGGTSNDVKIQLFIPNNTYNWSGTLQCLDSSYLDTITSSLDMSVVTTTYT